MELVPVLEWIAAIGLMLVGFVTVADWIVKRTVASGYIALSVFLLGLVEMSSRIMTLTGVTAYFSRHAVIRDVYVDGILIALAVSALALYRFRNSLFPRKRTMDLLVFCAVGLSVILTLVIPLPSTTGSAYSYPLIDLMSILYTIIMWTVVVGMTVISLWARTYTLPSVQKSRVRTLALGYGLLVAILLVALLGGNSFSSSSNFQIVTEIVIILFVPMIYVSLFPPKALRTLWRVRGEEEFAKELSELIRLSPTPQELADHSTVWAANMVGAAGCAILDPAGTVISAHYPGQNSSRRYDPLMWSEDAARNVIGIPLEMGKGKGRLVLRVGPITPAFGKDELARLELYTINLGAAFHKIELIEHLRASQEEALVASKAKSDFLARMSHELRTPLGAILGFSELLADGMEGPVNEAQHEDLDRIRSAGRHLLALLDEVLDLSRIEAGRMELYLADVPLRDTIESAIATLEPVAQLKQIALSSEGGDGFIVRADPQKASQVLFNLLNNALKFTDVGTVVVSIEQQDTQARISVTDTGIGIPREEQGKIFDEFRQAGVAQQRGGTGLGLAISRSIVELHGGTIGCSSEPGKGSTFWFTLPLVSVTETEDLRHPSPAFFDENGEDTEVAGKRHAADVVVVLDDNPESRSFLMKQLKSEGLQSIEATSVPEVVQITRTIRPSAIAVDIHMPVRDELKVLRDLNSGVRTRDIPVVMTTSTETNPIVIPIEKVSFIQKPFAAQQLVDLIGHYLPKRQGRRLLVVDDDPAVQRLVARALQKEDVMIYAAMNGQEGLERAVREKPDLIIADLIMPAMSGFEMIAQLRAFDSTRHIPVVVVSAKRLEEGDLAFLSGQIARFSTREDLQEIDLGGTIRKVISEHAEAKAVREPK